MKWNKRNNDWDPASCWLKRSYRDENDVGKKEKKTEQQKPDSEIWLRKAGCTEWIKRERQGKCGRELRGSNLVNNVAWPWPAADTSDHL